jgi:glutamyl-tRNA synthetase
LERLNPAPAAINFTKFDHFNGLHIRHLPIEELAKRVKPFLVEKGYSVSDETLLKVTPLIQERLHTLDEAPEIAGFFFVEDVQPVPEELLVKDLSVKQSYELAERILAILKELPDMQVSTTEPPMRQLVEETGLKPAQVFGLIRVAVTGQKVSPPLFESMEIIGKNTVIKRMEKALVLLKQMEEQSAA